MTRTAGPAYTVHRFEPADETEVLGLLGRALAGGPTGERTVEFLRWKHEHNPFGRSFGLLARDSDGALAAVRLLMRWQLAWGGATVTAVRAVDTATHPQHQGRGLFRRLTTEALDELRADTDLVFNTPNDQSRPGYLSMGWEVVGQLPVHLRPVRWTRVARHVRATGQSAVTQVEAPVPSRLPPAADVLSRRADEVGDLLTQHEQRADRDRLRTRLTPELLWWRYASPPGLDYRAVVVEGRAGLDGLGLGRLRRRGPLTELTLGLVLTREPSASAYRAVLRAAARAGTDHVTTMLPEATRRPVGAWRAGYLRVPGQGLTLTARPLREIGADVTSATSWALCLGDLEVF